VDTRGVLLSNILSGLVINSGSQLLPYILREIDIPVGNEDFEELSTLSSIKKRNGAAWKILIAIVPCTVEPDTTVTAEDLPPTNPNVVGPAQFNELEKFCTKEAD
jgi:hypothetical protein